MPVCRKAAPKISCTQTHAAEAAVSAGVLGQSPVSCIGTASCNQALLVNRATATTAQKRVCANVACPVEMYQGKPSKTVNPPRMAWPNQAARAIQPSAFIQL